MERSFKVFHLDEVSEVPMQGGRGIQKLMVNGDCGATALDVHLNRLKPAESGGRYHHHSVSDNVYIVRSGEGCLVVEGKTYTIREDDVIYIPSGLRHSLTNAADRPLEIFEIYSPAGDQFDFIHDGEDV
ncbi:MAG: cupin domain-containing protein [Pseudomonadota bacterium]|nr:cupin domain-containing protein [Pseudomonadota bacterium]